MYDLADIALDYVARILPGATTVVMGGSASTGRRTATSDMDLLAFAPADDFENGRSVALVAHHRGERIDVFAYTHDGFREWAERELAQFLLLANNRWLGSGKWLGRRLREWSPDIADRVSRAAAESDPRRLAQLAGDLLEPYGGRIDSDFIR